jgi:hypothetical protein
MKMIDIVFHPAHWCLNERGIKTPLDPVIGTTCVYQTELGLSNGLITWIIIAGLDIVLVITYFLLILVTNNGDFLPVFIHYASFHILLSSFLEYDKIFQNHFFYNHFNTQTNALGFGESTCITMRSIALKVVSITMQQ